MYLKASRGTRAQSVTVNAIDSGFHPHSKKWNIFFHFLCSGVNAKRGVEFRHSTLGKGTKCQ